MSRRATTTARVAALAASAAAGALLLAACAPTTTTLDYAPSDGARVDLADMKLRGINLLVVSEGDGEPGNVLGALTNHTGDSATFRLEAEGASPVTISLDAGETVYLGTADGEAVQLDAVDAIPGGSIPAVLTAGDESQEFQLPVFDGTLPEYADYLP